MANPFYIICMSEIFSVVFSYKASIVRSTEYGVEKKHTVREIAPQLERMRRESVGQVKKISTENVLQNCIMLFSIHTVCLFSL